MKRLISVVLVGVFAILAMVIPAEAQGRAQRYPGDYGRYDRGDVQCRYDRYGRPYDCRRIDRRYDRRGGGSVGSFVVGAVVGGVVGAVIASRKNRSEQSVYQQSPEPVELAQPVAGPVTNVGEGQFELSNSTKTYVEAYDGDTYVGRMAPEATMKVGPPKDRYRGFALVPQSDGRLGKDEVGREATPLGWKFVEVVK